MVAVPYAIDDTKNHKNRKAVLWENLTEGDTGDAAYLEGGIYNVTAVGTFGQSAELQYSPDNSSFVSIDSTNLTFSTAGTYNFEMPRGYYKPVLAGSGTTDINFYVAPLPSDAA